MTKERLYLLGFGALALAMILSPAIVYRLLTPTFCPTQVLSEGRIPGGVNYEITRSDCGGERTIFQVRVAPPQGVLRLALDAEGEPRPVSITQLGRVLTIRLDGPEGREVRVELDHRARPREPLKLKAGQPLG